MVELQLQFFDAEIAAEILPAGMQLDAPALRDGLRDGAVYGSGRLYVLGQDIQQTAMAKQQLGYLPLKILQRQSFHPISRMCFTISIIEQVDRISKRRFAQLRLSGDCGKNRLLTVRPSKFGAYL